MGPNLGRNMPRKKKRNATGKNLGRFPLRTHRNVQWEKIGELIHSDNRTKMQRGGINAHMTHNTKENATGLNWGKHPLSTQRKMHAITTKITQT